MQKRHYVALLELQDLQFFELFQSTQDILLDQELNENILKPYLFDRFLKTLVGQHYVVTVAINEQNILVLNFSVPSGYARGFQVLLFGPIVALYLLHSGHFLTPLCRNQL